MPNIKTHLTDIFDGKNIPKLVRYTANYYRPHDPGQYLYNLITQYSNKTKFTEEFIELTYTTLIAWNMNQRGAKLSDFKIFKNSILKHEQSIKSLENYKIEFLDNTEQISPTIKQLFDNLQLVNEGKPKLVTFSKTMHYFLPHLLMPIDRSHTLKLFYRSFPDEYNKQYEMYMEVFNEFWKLVQVYDFKSHLDNSWNRNIPKTIDNIIIAYVKTELKS
jgi:hypothetical protein